MTIWRGAAIIIELKVAKNIRELESKCDEALNQIEDREYDKPLIEDGRLDAFQNVVARHVTRYKIGVSDCLMMKEI